MAKRIMITGIFVLCIFFLAPREPQAQVFQTDCLRVLPSSSGVNYLFTCWTVDGEELDFATSPIGAIGDLTALTVTNTASVVNTFANIVEARVAARQRIHVLLHVIYVVDEFGNKTNAVSIIRRNGS